MKLHILLVVATALVPYTASAPFKSEHAAAEELVELLLRRLEMEKRQPGGPPSLEAGDQKESPGEEDEEVEESVNGRKGPGDHSMGHTFAGIAKLIGIFDKNGCGFKTLGGSQKGEKGRPPKGHKGTQETDFEKLVENYKVSPGELQAVLDEMRETGNNTVEGIKRAEAKAADITDEKSRANFIKEVHEDMSKLLKEHVCASQKIGSYLLRLELLGPKGFEKSQYKCRSTVKLFFRLLFKSRKEKKPMYELIDATVKEQYTKAVVADMLCIGKELQRVHEDLENIPEITEKSDPTAVGRQLGGVYLDGVSVFQDIKNLDLVGKGMYWLIQAKDALQYGGNKDHGQGQAGKGQGQAGKGHGQAGKGQGQGSQKEKGSGGSVKKRELDLLRRILE